MNSIQELHQKVINSLGLPQVKEAMKSVLIQQVSDLEIKEALFSIKPEKSPRPDGFNVGFYQSNWNLVGQDVINAVKSFSVLGAWGIC